MLCARAQNGDKSESLKHCKLVEADDSREVEKPRKNEARTSRRAQTPSQRQMHEKGGGLYRPARLILSGVLKAILMHSANWDPTIGLLRKQIAPDAKAFSLFVCSGKAVMKMNGIAGACPRNWL